MLKPVDKTRPEGCGSSGACQLLIEFICIYIGCLASFGHVFIMPSNVNLFDGKFVWQGRIFLSADTLTDMKEWIQQIRVAMDSAQTGSTAEAAVEAASPHNKKRSPLKSSEDKFVKEAAIIEVDASAYLLTICQVWPMVQALWRPECGSNQNSAHSQSDGNR